jgi:LmbE family N-acetylglucosaminyl deacetylase
MDLATTRIAHQSPPSRAARPIFRQWFARTLVLAPHCDDEVFCGGLIARLTDERCHVDVAVAVADDVRSRTAKRVIRGEERLEELEVSTSILGLKPDQVHVGFAGSNVRLDRLPQRRIVSWLDDLLEGQRPTAVLLPYPSHHVDHQVVHNAARSALRHDPGGTVHFAALWEYPYILTDPWDSEVQQRGRVTFDITGSPFQAKLRAMQAHRSQLAGKPKGHLISPEGIEKLAMLRGLEIGRDHGESYYLIHGAIL